jgi:NAD(P)H-flavin reductase
MPADELNATVIQRIEVSPELVILRIVPRGWELPEFEAGQFAVLGLPASAPRSGDSGHLQDLWASRRLAQSWGFDPSPETTHIFLCGNPSMIEQMVEILEAGGYREHSRREPGQIHVERYWQRRPRYRSPSSDQHDKVARLEHPGAFGRLFQQCPVTGNESRS